MKKTIIILAPIFIVVALWFLLVTNKRPPTSETQTGEQNSLKEIILGEDGRYMKLMEKREVRRGEALKKIIQSENVPIDFWGKVVDQAGEPISGAMVKYHIRQPKRMWYSDIVEREIKSNTNGDFHISGDKGDVLSIDGVTAIGCHQVKGQRGVFNYRRSYRPDKIKPEVFTLIKDEDLPNLISAERWTTLRWDGSPVYYSLRTGRYGQKGEIKITAMRGEVLGEGRQARFDWSFRVEVPRGGIMETTQGSSFQAPKAGYEAFWEFSRTSSDKKWSYGKGQNTHLFIRLQDGSYARIKVNFSSELENPYSCDITSYLNPSGGRILEYDASRRIKNSR